jgi:hypothetical protein
MYAYLKNHEVRMKIAGIPNSPAWNAIARIREKMTMTAAGAARVGRRRWGRSFEFKNLITLSS